VREHLGAIRLARALALLEQRQVLVDTLGARVEQLAPLYRVHADGRVERASDGEVVTFRIYGGEWYPDAARRDDERFWAGFNAHNERVRRERDG
jgi:hypothetical protein